MLLHLYLYPCRPYLPSRGALRVALVAMLRLLGAPSVHLVPLGKQQDPQLTLTANPVLKGNTLVNQVQIGTHYSFLTNITQLFPNRVPIPIYRGGEHDVAVGFVFSSVNFSDTDKQRLVIVLALQ